MHILAATDGSDGAMRAIEFAAKLTKDLDGLLKIVHVIEVYDIPFEQLETYSHWEHVSPGEFLNKISEQVLTAAVELAKEVGVPEVETISLSGDVASCIIDIAHRMSVDTIVIGKRGVGHISGMLFGSVSHKLVSLAHCQVIVVP